MVRRWNPTREARPPAAEDRTLGTDEESVTSEPQNVHKAGGKVRPVWDNPILWREMRTWAYGKKIAVVHITYVAIFAVCAAALIGTVWSDGATRSVIPAAATPLAPLLVISLILLNALAVTSLTNERDMRALDPLLVTDLTPREIVFGKLGGAFYTAKEMILLPTALWAYLWWADQMTTENLVFLIIGLLTMFAFAAMLGLHAGMTYANSRTAIATSVGTLLFLFLGVMTGMRIMLAFSSSFLEQLGPFLIMTLGGGVALYAALGMRNHSGAMGWAFVPAPFFTFFAMTSYLMGQYGLVFLVTIAVYGFATAAMLVPAIAEFDVATGRTGARDA